MGILTILIYMAAFGMFHVAVDTGRYHDSKLQLFSRNWWKSMALIIIGAMLVATAVTIDIFWHGNK